MNGPEYGWYGDDFTGATDTLAELASRGMRALLFLGLPDAARLKRAGPLDAVGLAGASRALVPGAMAAELAPVGRFFRDLGVRMMHYKCCSTFDSASEVGSIGSAVATLRPFFSNPFRPIVGGQPNLGRYTLFGHLFAAAGTGAAVHRIDRHPTMRAHPVTPMAEADLRLHLAAQGLDAVNLPYLSYDHGELATEMLLDRLLAAEPDAVLMDVSREADLAAIGHLLRSRSLRAPLLAVGPSGVAQAWCAGTAIGPGRAVLGRKAGPVLVLAGSLSPVTRRQVAEATDYRCLTVDPAVLIDDAAGAAATTAEACRLLRAGEDLLIVTQSPGDAAPASDKVAAATATLLAQIMQQHPVRRLGIAGGDTSSFGTRALDLWGLSHVGSLAPGIALCHGHSDNPVLDGLEVMLKGGQMGAPDLLARFRV
ncbi:four-carbon acid sugar kinase family protein [Teichococcus vastitatis]|uniref:Four-carbon acid sugar kinase family protein n=1 Tax=Teichococcus vastitatis TaxID=2307076 RepID=A0ABS9W857_9PROT|nr:four-carbon acid sugar kinase family protein [Pseudoroseomonas vastitatis]MCI0755413.1 four-carbon acid sugar kinase family protein [Pseudoroseomonas vastitatis]